MKNKQDTVLHGRSHPDLVLLDNLKTTLSYPGWHSDFIDAENSRLSEYLTFNDCLFTLEEKQRMFEGNRSHRRLQKLDSQSFSYPGWRADFKRAQEIHTSAETGLAELGFSSLLETMENKQLLHNGAEGHSQQDLPTTLPSSERSSNECVICLASPKTHAFIPCGHLCACGRCATESMERSDACPLCRKGAITVSQIFFS